MTPDVRFGPTIATSTLVMFGLMYLNTYALDHGMAAGTGFHDFWQTSRPKIRGEDAPANVMDGWFDHFSAQGIHSLSNC